MEREEVRERAERRMNGVYREKKRRGFTKRDREVGVREMDGEREYE